MSNPICSLREKISALLADKSPLQRRQNLVPLQIRDKTHGLFRSETFSAQWPFIYAGNKF